MLYSKKDVILEIANKTKANGLTKRDIELVLETHAQVITQSLHRCEEATLVGLGKIAAKIRPGRIGRNPRNGASVEIAPSMGIKFKAASSLKDALN